MQNDNAKFKNNPLLISPLERGRKIRRWIIPISLAVMLFMLTRPVFANLVEREALLSSFLSSQNVAVGVMHDKNGNPRIYYDFDGSQTVITNDDIPHADPVTDGKYIAWMSLLGQNWQIFLYHIPTDLTIQLSQNNGNNVNPRIAKDRVVWEGQVEGVWQVFLYDGGQVKQLTEGGEPSINADLEGDYIVYATKQDFGEWKSFAYDIRKDEDIFLTPNSFSKKPILKNSRVYWNDFNGSNRSVLEYDLPARNLGRLSSGLFPAYGVRIEGGKVKWFEEIPDPSPEINLPSPPEPEEGTEPNPILVSEEEVAGELGALPAPEEAEPQPVPASEPPPPAPEAQPAPEIIPVPAEAD